MDITIKINMDNDAFGDNPALELARILKKMSENICVVHGGMKEKIIDINGNTCGKVTVKD